MGSSPRPQLRVHRRGTLPRAAAVAALALVVGCSPVVPEPSVTPTPRPPAHGIELVQRATIPNVQVPGSLTPVAGTGTAYVIEGEWADDPARYTMDDGRTWHDVPAGLHPRSHEGRFGSFIGYRENFVGVRQEPAPDYSYSGFQRWDPASGEVTSLDFDLDPELPEDGDFDIAVFPIDYIGTLVLLNDSRIFDISGTQALPVEPRLPTDPGLDEVQWQGLTRNGQYAVGKASGAAGSYLVVGPLTAQGSPTAIEVPGLQAVDVSADRIHYLAGTASQLRVCRAEVISPAAARCVKIATGQARTRPFVATLTTSDGADQVFYMTEDGQGRQRWFVRGARATRVSKDGWDWLPYRDTEAPMAMIWPDQERPALAAAVADDGTAEPLFAAPTVPSAPYVAGMAADRVAYQQRRVTESGEPVRRVAFRPFDGNELGEEVVVADREIGRLQVSGDRTAIQSEGNADSVLVFSDQLVETGRVAVSDRRWLEKLSGPYALLADNSDKVAPQVVRADGKGVDTGQVMALFGSLVVEASARDEAPGRTFTVRDLELPAAPPTPVELPDPAGRTYRNTVWGMWGEWLHATYIADTHYRSLLFNYRTGESIDVSESPAEVTVGDGWVLLRDGTGGARLRVLATGEEVELEHDKLFNVATDGGRTLAWSALEGAWVGTIEGLPPQVPRLLGVVGAAELTADGAHAWTPQFDLTAPTGPGTLEIAGPDGTVVARLPVAAAPSGSIRGVTWDGRADTGLVAAGDYTWTLAVDGATSVDGLRQASGSLVVRR